MPYDIIKHIPQSTLLGSAKGLSGTGVCYDMCSFLESNMGIWCQPNTFLEAVSRARGFNQGNAMINFAKAKNSQLGSTSHPLYQNYTSTTIFKKNYLYRVEVSLQERGFIPVVHARGNHEMIMITGEHDDFVCFNPNLGFILIESSSSPPLINFYSCMKSINAGYNSQAIFYRFLEVRNINSALPKGY